VPVATKTTVNSMVVIKQRAIARANIVKPLLSELFSCLKPVLSFRKPSLANAGNDVSQKIAGVGLG
jgi:hypothetical protein